MLKPFSPPRMLCFVSLLSSLALLLGVTPAKGQEDSSGFSPLQIVRLAFHSSIVVGNTLYIDGGQVSFLNNGQINTVVPMNDTLSIDLSVPFNSSDNAQIKKNSKSSGTPILQYGSLWASGDNTSFYNFGGELAGQITNPPVDVWQYTPSEGGLTYASVPSSSSPQSPTLAGLRPTCAFSAYGNGIGYMLGGYDGAIPRSYWTTPIPGLLIYNMTANTWSNESAQGYSTYGTALNGRMHFLPSFGSLGVLALLGGEVSSPTSWLEEGNNHVPFSNITIYDTESKSWYWQAATGATGSNDIPPPGTMFCSALASDAGSGTVEIFMYGGHSDAFVDWANGYEPNSSQETAQAVYNIVYVLSIPGFVWFKADDTSAHPRTGHSCELVGNRQMLSIGGLDPTTGWNDPNNKEDPWSTIDPWNQTLDVFDMSELTWKGAYDPQASPYQVPQAVHDWYAQPLSNDSVKWTDSATRSLFFRSDSSNRTAGSPSSPSVTASPPDTSSPSATLLPPNNSSSLPAGIIAGIVVACVAGLALIVALAFFVRRWRRRHTPIPTNMGMLREEKATGRGMNASEPRDMKQAAEMDTSPLRSEMDGRPPPIEIAERDPWRSDHPLELPSSPNRR